MTDDVAAIDEIRRLADLAATAAVASRSSDDPREAVFYTGCQAGLLSALDALAGRETCPFCNGPVYTIPTDGVSHCAFCGAYRAENA
jgi:hypothetical protein